PIDDQIGDLQVVLLDHEDVAITEYSCLRQDKGFRFTTCIEQGLLCGVRLSRCGWIPITDDEQDRDLAIERDILWSAKIRNSTLERHYGLEFVGPLQGAQPTKISRL